MTIDIECVTARRDAAYDERMHRVAALARLFRSGIKNITTVGWTQTWKGCVHLDLSTGQIRYHYHTRHADVFRDHPPNEGEWDGHDKNAVIVRIKAPLEVASSHD